MLNFDDRALKEDAYEEMKVMMMVGLMFAVVGGCFAMFLANPFPQRVARS